jgi:GTP cyclohydrolase II
MAEKPNKVGEELVVSHLPTDKGDYSIYAFESGKVDAPHIALVSKDLDKSSVVDIRIHSECLTGDVFGSLRCDCGEQLQTAMRHFEEHGGVLLYLRQEGRGIGLVNKLKAYNLQDEGMDTAEANIALGFHADERDYSPAISILHSLGIKQVRILTNNPEKFEAFENSGITVIERLALKMPSHRENEFYLDTKKRVFGHWL